MNILYVCAGNAARSQMAEAFSHMLLPGHNSYSAGTSPRIIDGSSVPIPVSECMAEVGYDMEVQYRKRLTPRMVGHSDKIIIVLQPHEVQQYIEQHLQDSPKTRYWPVKDPRGATSKDVFQSCRDEIRHYVEKLSDELK